MSPQEINKLIDQKIQDAQSSYTNLNTVQHRHTGMDMLKVRSFDIDTNNPQGFVFFSTSHPNTSFNIHTLPPLAGADILSIDSYLAGQGVFSIGGDIPFYDVASFAINSNVLEVANLAGTTLSIVAVHPTDVTFSVNDGVHIATSKLTSTLQKYTATGNFALELPDTTKPTAVKGMLAFESATGGFQASIVSGTWVYFPTSDGTTTGSTVPAGTVKVTINGIDYNLLHD